ncbi:hypothetical protein BC828DRAFT_406188 [Blastocladiella britannica]|nr:hypothetical protein BC828DRAFT_406188 [Blastocladiella britannica]
MIVARTLTTTRSTGPAVATAAIATATAVRARAIHCPVPANLRNYPLKKQILVADYRSHVLSNSAVLVASAADLTEADWQKLRVALRPLGFGVTSIANGVFSVAATQHGAVAKRLSPHLTGHNAAVYTLPPSIDAASPKQQPSKKSAVVPPPLINDPAVLNTLLSALPKAGGKKVVIKAAVVNGVYMTAPELARFAALPSLDQLRGQLVGLLQAPGQRLVGMLGQNQSALAAILGQRVADMESAASTPAPAPSA